MTDPYRWIRGYEARRHSRGNYGPNESWVSTKYDFTDPNIRLEYVPEMHCNMGGCISALKKLWKSYKIASRTGETRSWQAYKITQLQKIMRLEESIFPELEGIQTDEKLTLTKEEEEESGFGTSADEEETSEYSELDKQLLKEERESEQENDDWWFS
jgi:hypothetical protein